MKNTANSTITFDMWLLAMQHSDSQDELFENYCFPNSMIKQEFINKIHSYDEGLIKQVLHQFLYFGKALGSDSFTLESIKADLQTNQEVFKHRVETSPYYRNAVKHAVSLGKYPIYPDITWINDLLPIHPRNALDIIDSFGIIHLAHLPDGRINGLFDAMTIIRARYFDKEVEKSLLYSLTPEEFEHIVEALYHAMDYETKMTKKSYDGGRDIIIEKNEAGKKEKSVISCKKLKNTVPIENIRSIFGVANFENNSKAILVTSSDFSIESQKLAQRQPRLELINYKTLQKLLNIYLGSTWDKNLNYYIQESRQRHPLETRS
ncbi:TPA: hypothetical protein ITS68_001611 [Enterococcus faecalis]|nr:hypothetical protein [Enterococcus faecalis]HAP3007514.1 hypothetical protein [Enterococcus faecalis]